MKTITQEDYTNSLFQLLRETFEGPPVGAPSAYLDQGAGLFQTLDALTAEAASARPWPAAATVASHCEHARFYVHALLDFMGGATAKVDWGQSWLVQSVTPDEWERLRADLRASYETLTGRLRAVESWGDEEVGDAMAILVHTAYHLGAVRQLARAATTGPR
jgi:hypothetical protein